MDQEQLDLEREKHLAERALMRCKRGIEQCVNPRYIDESLVESGVFTKKETEDFVMNRGTTKKWGIKNREEIRKESVMKMLDSVHDAFERDPRKLPKLCDALEKDNAYPWISKRLQYEYEAERQVESALSESRGRRASGSYETKFFGAKYLPDEVERISEKFGAMGGWDDSKKNKK